MDKKETVKFMQVLNQPIYGQLQEIAKQRGITVQELLRVAMIPEWLEADKKGQNVHFVSPGFVRRELLKISRGKKHK